MSEVMDGNEQVTSIFSCVLDLGSDELVTHLFKECDFLDWLVRAPMEVTAVPYPNDKRQGISNCQTTPQKLQSPRV